MFTANGNLLRATIWSKIKRHNSIHGKDLLIMGIIFEADNLCQ